MRLKRRFGSEAGAWSHEAGRFRATAWSHEAGRFRATAFGDSPSAGGATAAFIGRDIAGAIDAVPEGEGDTTASLQTLSQNGYGVIAPSSESILCDFEGPPFS